MLLTYREETKQPRHPITGLPAPWVLSSAGKLIRYLHGSYISPYRNTVSTPDASGAARQNTRELIIISDAVYTGCGAATQQIPDSKLLPRSIYDILTQISNDFQRSLCRVQCRQTATVQCRHGVSLLLFRRRFPLLFFIRHLYFSVIAWLGHVHWWVLSPHIMSRHAPYCWLATSLFWYWAQLSFLKRFWKKYIPHL